MSRTFKEVLASFKKDIACGFQAQKNLADISAKYLGELEAAYDGGGVGGINYSAEEQDTGLKWIDGSAIYQKTALVENISITSNSDTNVNISDYFTGVSKLLSAEIISSDGNMILPAINVSSSLSAYSIGVSYDVTSDHIVFTRGSGSNVTISVYITLRYIKSA